MSIEFRDDSALIHVPQFDVPLGIARREQPVVRRENDGRHFGRVGLQFLQPLPGRGIPQLSRLVVAASHDPLGMVRQRHCRCATTPVESQQLSARADIPDAGRVIDGGRQQLVAVGKERRGRGEVRVPFGKCQSRLTGDGIPRARRPIATRRDDLLLIVRVGRREDCIRVTVQHTALQCANLFVTSDAPLAHRVVVSGRQDAATVRQKRRRLHSTTVATKRFESLPRCEIPDAHGVVLTGAEQQRTIGRETHGANGIDVTFKRAEVGRGNDRPFGDVLEIERFYFFRVPRQQATVVTGRHDLLAIGRERRRVDRAAMSRERGRSFVGGNLPHDRGSVLSGCDDARLVSRERRRVDPPGVTGKFAEFLPTDRVPQPRGLVIRAGQQSRPILRERDTQHRVFVAFDCRQTLPGRDIPNLDKARSVVAARGEKPTVGRERDAIDVVTAVLHRREDLPRLAVPHARGPVPATRRETLATLVDGQSVQWGLRIERPRALRTEVHESPPLPVPQFRLAGRKNFASGIERVLVDLRSGEADLRDVRLVLFFDLRLFSLLPFGNSHLFSSHSRLLRFDRGQLGLFLLDLGRFEFHSFGNSHLLGRDSRFPGRNGFLFRCDRCVLGHHRIVPSDHCVFLALLRSRLRNDLLLSRLGRLVAFVLSDVALLEGILLGEIRARRFGNGLLLFGANPNRGSRHDDEDGRRHSHRGTLQKHQPPLASHAIILSLDQLAPQRRVIGIGLIEQRQAEIEVLLGLGAPGIGQLGFRHSRHRAFVALP